MATTAFQSQGRMLGADAALAENMMDGIRPLSAGITAMQRNSRSNRSLSAIGSPSRLAAMLREIEL